MLLQIQSLIDLDDDDDDDDNENSPFPRFSLCGDIVSTLVLVFFSGDNIGIRQKAVSMLDSVFIRDGIWESREVAQLLKTMLEAWSSQVNEILGHMA